MFPSSVPKQEMLGGLPQACFFYRSRSSLVGSIFNLKADTWEQQAELWTRSLCHVPCPCLLPAPLSLLCESQCIHSHFQGSKVRPGHLVSLLHHAVELAVHHHARIGALPCDRKKSRGGSQTTGFNTAALRGGKRQPGASPGRSQLEEMMWDSLF